MLYAAKLRILAVPIGKPFLAAASPREGPTGQSALSVVPG